MNNHTYRRPFRTWLPLVITAGLVTALAGCGGQAPAETTEELGS